MELRFLGTGGGRYATARQTRQTGGIVITSKETQIHVDPGPGAIVYSNKELDSPENTEAVLITHAHHDHYSDAEAIIEQITQINQKPGTILANHTVLNGIKDMEKQITEYHQDLCQNIHNLNEDEKIKFKDLEIETTALDHNDPNTIGFKVGDGDVKIGFWIDTCYKKNLTKFYEDCKILVINCLLSRKMSSKKHTSISDIPSLIEETRPETAILTHFGSYLLEDNKLEENKEWLKEECKDKDTQIIFAKDNMKYPGNIKLSSF